jgi:hypothetical protein
VRSVRIRSNSKETSAQPILGLQQNKSLLDSKIKNIRSNNSKIVDITSKLKKRYQKPGYQKLTPEQIKLILIGQFNLGDESAGDLLDQLFPESHPGAGQHEKSRE